MVSAYAVTLEELCPLHTQNLIWDENNVTHLWQSHRVSPEEVEEILLGCPGETRVRHIRSGEMEIITSFTGKPVPGDF